MRPVEPGQTDNAGNQARPPPPRQAIPGERPARPASGWHRAAGTPIPGWPAT